MVTLSKIYTRTGDEGTTYLGDYSRVDKTDVRVEAYGSVDELNAALGVCLLGPLSAECSRIVRRVQNDLFDLGADLCKPQREGEEDGTALRLAPAQVRRLEEEIDALNARLEPLRSFVLPGGSSAATWLHLARTICRRAERRVWKLAHNEKINEQIMVYLNRLSDLLFVMARAENDGEKGDILWEPGRNQERENG